LLTEARRSTWQTLAGTVTGLLEATVSDALRTVSQPAFLSVVCASATEPDRVGKSQKNEQKKPFFVEYD
jgi:hypothetical protein